MTPPEQVSTTNPAYLPAKLSNTRCLRLYKDDDEEIALLCGTIKKLDRNMDIVTMIRDCVQAGLPVVRKRWEPLIKDEAAPVPGAN